MLNSKKILITAGPTWEAIDPVRGITNHSSGKMGYAIAAQAFSFGAEVKLVSGPVCLSPPAGVETIQVFSARDMYDAVFRQLEANDIDVFIGVAAVADYRPANVHSQKIKKTRAKLTLELVKNPDIVRSVARLSSKRPHTVAFAAETENLQANAFKKLVDKKLDMVVANDVSKLSIGFGSDQNQVLIITHEQTIDSGKQEKIELANILLQHISKHLQEPVT